MKGTAIVENAEESEKLEEKSYLDQLKSNGLFRDFMDDSFDAQDYANRIIESHIIGESLAKLANGIQLLNKEIMTQVASHHEDLLSQATGIETLEGVLNSIQSRCQSLTKCIERVRSQVTEPYNRIASRTRQLRRLQTTCEYLRRIIRILHLSKRLRTQLKGGSREITKAAQSLHELGYALEGVDLSGIKIIEDDLKGINIAQREIGKQAKQMLDQGLNTQNQTLIGTALQVFQNLGTLKTHVNEVIENSIQQMENCIHQAVDPSTLKTSLQALNNVAPSGPGRASMPTLGNMTAWRTALWDRLEKLTSKLFDWCQRLFTLEKVLLKKRDPITHVSFIEMFTEDGCSKVFQPFWNSICSCLRSEFDQSTQASTYLKQAFEGEYPKLLRLFNDFWSQVSSLVDSKHSRDTSSFFTKDTKFGFVDAHTSPLDSLKSALNPFENAYLSRSLSRLLDPINLVFPNGAQSVPSKDELNSIIKAISSELNVASVDEHLLLLVSKNVAKTVQLYLTKCEQILVTTSDAGQLTGGLTTSQIRNASICNSLDQLKTGIAEILPNLVYPPQEAINILDQTLTNISSFMEVTLSLLLSSIMTSLYDKMARIQTENYAISVNSYHETSETQSCSRYVSDIQVFISQVQSDYLPLYNCKDFLLDRLEVLAGRVLELFVSHVSLLRDISEGGKLKLAADMAQLEFAVTPFCRRFEDLRESYKLFRSFRPLLFQTIEDIPSNPNIGESLPYSSVLHFLFSKAPPQLLSPHTVAGWTVAEYLEWLDNHQEEDERLALIRGTLEAYAQKTRDKITEAPAVYALMMRLLDQQKQSPTAPTV